jgi:putative transposase
VSELAADGVPVAVTCRVLKLARQPYYRWLANPITDAERTQAYRANAVFDAHRDDPEFGYRFLHHEARRSGEAMAARTAWKICRDNAWWSAFGKKTRGKNTKAGPPVHDDLVQRDFTATAPNRLWVGDITEHRTTWIPAVVATLERSDRRCPDRGTPQRPSRSSSICWNPRCTGLGSVDSPRS